MGPHNTVTPVHCPSFPVPCQLPPARLVSPCDPHCSTDNTESTFPGVKAHELKIPSPYIRRHTVKSENPPTKQCNAGKILEYVLKFKGSSGGVVVKLLACGVRGPGFDSRSRRYGFRDWLSPASKSLYD